VRKVYLLPVLFLRWDDAQSGTSVRDGISNFMTLRGAQTGPVWGTVMLVISVVNDAQSALLLPAVLPLRMPRTVNPWSEKHTGGERQVHPPPGL